jgi:hypothetical protein
MDAPLDVHPLLDNFKIGHIIKHVRDRGDKLMPEKSNKYKELFLKVRKDLESTVKFGQLIIEKNRGELQSNFPLRFPMLLLHEALQAGRGFVLMTKEDLIDYPAGAIILLRNGFESIVWGFGCLDDKEGPDLIDYMWDHQDKIIEEHLKIYKKLKIEDSEEILRTLEEAKSRLDARVSLVDNQTMIPNEPSRDSFALKQIKRNFERLIDTNGWFKYFYKICYKGLSTETWHSSIFGMRLTQYEDVKFYFLAFIGEGFVNCLKVFINESLRKLSGTDNLASALHREMGESLKKQMMEIAEGKDLKIMPSVKLQVK